MKVCSHDDFFCSPGSSTEFGVPELGSSLGPSSPNMVSYFYSISLPSVSSPGQKGCRTGRVVGQAKIGVKQEAGRFTITNREHANVRFYEGFTSVQSQPHKIDLTYIP